MDEVKFFKGCLPQILLGSFLNTLSHIICLIRDWFNGKCLFLQIRRIQRIKNKTSLHWTHCQSPVICITIKQITAKYIAPISHLLVN